MSKETYIEAKETFFSGKIDLVNRQRSPSNTWIPAGREECTQMLLSGAPPLSAPPAPSEREVEAGRKGRGMEGGRDGWMDGGREGGGGGGGGGERERERGRARERMSARARMCVLIGQVHFCVGMCVCLCVVLVCVCVCVCVREREREREIICPT